MIHFVSTSQELAFDHVLGEGRPRVFLPSQFTPQGDAIDPGGGICTETACPKCHLPVPRLLAQYPIMSVSIFGAPGSGKSFLLASMTHSLMQHGIHYGMTAEDVDPLLNAIVRDYERTLFHRAQHDTALIQLAKTGEAGDWYNTIFERGREKQLPKPFLYRIERAWPNDRGLPEGQILCLYDNAGESFQPGADTEQSPVTRHMAKANALVFVFDPTQEAVFGRACADKSDDPQWRGGAFGDQVALFTEAVKRVRSYRSMLPNAVIETPLLVLLPKFDAWEFLLGELPPPYKEISVGKTGGSSIRVLDVDALLNVSKRCREMLQRYMPAVVAKIESSFNRKTIFYLPVSATGCSPTRETEEKPKELDLSSLESLDVGSSALLADAEPQNPEAYGKFRAQDIKPIWAEVPFLAILKLLAPKLFPRVKK